MKIAASKLGHQATLEKMEIRAEALESGVLLAVPTGSDVTAQFLIAWEDLRKAIPAALMEFGPKMGAGAR